MKKISLCTVCMNRLEYLSQTLPVNLAENRDNPNIEFLLLDYNSRDNMEYWVKANLGEYLESGFLKYYKTYEPEYFHLAHSKNLILKLATGDILGMVDADNFAGPDYAGWIEKSFETNGSNTITTTLRKDSIPYRDQGGKMCFSKEIFYSVNGFDEALIGYGMDDVDLVNRLENSGGKRVFIDEEKYLKFIGHSDIERLKNYRYPNLLQNIYLYMTEPLDYDNARFLYLFRDNTFSEMNYKYKETLKTNLVVTFLGWTIERHDGRRDGRFIRQEGGLSLMFDDGIIDKYAELKTKILTGPHLGKESYWKEIFEDDGLYMHAVLGYCECFNRLRFVENDNNINRINEKGWGQGTVYFNFDNSRPIEV